LRLQRAGIPVQIVLGDLDAYNGKNVDLAYTHYLAARYSTFIQELGFRNEPPSTLRNQHDSLSILRSAYLLGNHVSDSELESAEEDLHDLYSQKQKVDKEMTYRRKLSLSLMIADFIELLTTAGFDGVLISLGIDEHRYVDLGRTIFRRQQAQDAPLAGKIYSAMYSSIIGGFNGYPKMSKSFPESGLSVDSTRDQIHHMILHGERLTPYPETNVVYQMISSVSLYGNDQILEAHRECGRQSMRWKAIKEDYANHLCELCRHWPSG